MLSQPHATPHGKSDAPRALGKPLFTGIAAHAWIGRRGDAMLVALFGALIALPLFTFALHIDTGGALTERRALATPPRWGRAGADMVLENLPAEIDAYFRDWFGFRARLIRLDTAIRHKWLRIPRHDVIFGKADWLFLVELKNIESILGAAALSEAELDSWQAYFQERQAALARRGVKHLFVIAPDKQSIYPEMLPDHIAARPDAMSRLDQLMQRMADRASPLLDLRPALRAAKTQGDLYYAQDTHWNGRGFFVAYTEVLARLARWFPDMHPLLLGRDVTLVTKPFDGGEWILLGLPEENLHYPSLFLARNDPNSLTRTPGRAPALFPVSALGMYAPRQYKRAGLSRSLVMFHDSFFHEATADGDYTPFAEHFGRTMAMHFTPDCAELLAMVEQEQADVVIEELVERAIRGTAPPRSCPERQEQR